MRYCNSMIIITFKLWHHHEGAANSNLATPLLHSTQEDKTKINMKKKQIHVAQGMLCLAKICIGSGDYYACLSPWKLMEQNYLILHEVQLKMLVIGVFL